MMRSALSTLYTKIFFPSQPTIYARTKAFEHDARPKPDPWFDASDQEKNDFEFQHHSPTSLDPKDDTATEQGLDRQKYAVQTIDVPLNLQGDAGHPFSEQYSIPNAQEAIGYSQEGFVSDNHREEDERSDQVEVWE